MANPRILLAVIPILVIVFALIAFQSSNNSSIVQSQITQTAVSTEAIATCPIRQYAINESSNGSFACASASNTNYLTTQTAVSTELSQTCTLPKLMGGENSTGFANCNEPTAINGKLPYGNLTGYPGACPSGQFYTNVSNPITCHAVIVEIFGIGSLNGVTTQFFMLSSSSATELNVVVPIAVSATLVHFYCQVKTGFTGTIKWVVRLGNSAVMVNTALNITQVNPLSGNVYHDDLHNASISQGQFVDFSVVTTGAVSTSLTSCGLGATSY